MILIAVTRPADRAASPQIESPSYVGSNSVRSSSPVQPPGEGEQPSSASSLDAEGPPTEAEPDATQESVATEAEVLDLLYLSESFETRLRELSGQLEGPAGASNKYVVYRLLSICSDMPSRLQGIPVGEYVDRFGVTDPAKLDYLYRISAQCKNDVVRSMLASADRRELLAAAAKDGFSLAQVELLKNQVLSEPSRPNESDYADIGRIIQSGDEAAIFKLASEVVYNAIDEPTGAALIITACERSPQVCMLFERQLTEMCRYSSSCAPGDTVTEHLARIYGDDLLRKSETIAESIQAQIESGGWSSVSLW